jgi:hypothetical protein
LGIGWPEPASADGQIENEILPSREKAYYVKYPQARGYGGEGPLTGSWKRLMISENSQALQTQEKLSALMSWAMRNGFDSLIFPFCCPEGVAEEAKLYALDSEAGGWTMSDLIPRKLFSFHKELFRMEGGKRQQKVHFCPTNPDTISIIRSHGKELFRAASGIRVFHLWPEHGEENTWCACPSCRAFTHLEQYLISVNAASDALVELYKDGFISFLESPDEEGDIPLRPNVFRINLKEIVTLRW